MGQILDNEEYKSNYSSYDLEPIIPHEQGLNFREIDMSAIPYASLKHDFKGINYKYDFKSVKNLPYLDWLKKEDMKGSVENYLTHIHDNEDYLLLNTHLDDKLKLKKDEDYPFWDIWFMVKSYVIKKDELDKYKDWCKKQKHFWNMSMLEGERSLYEGWIAEYPWSPFFHNIFNQVEEEESFTEISTNEISNNLMEMFKTLSLPFPNDGNIQEAENPKIQDKPTKDFMYFITAHNYNPERDSIFW